jgi:hypothetical protein
MGRINTARVVLGGLLAGVVSNVSGILLAHYILGDEVRALLQRLHVQPGTGTALLHVSMRLALGLGVVWLYAAVRPRFGPGPRTAMLAGLVMWLLTDAFSFLGISSYGLYSNRGLAIAAAWGLVELQVMALLGAYFYREES